MANMREISKIIEDAEKAGKAVVYKDGHINGVMIDPEIRASLACRAIKHAFPPTSEGNLMFAIVEVAIEDLCRPPHPKGRRTHYGMQIENERDSSKSYFRDEVVHAEIAGVSSEWIKGKMRDLGIDV
jgi:uncharacterized caspase-like protein